MIQLLYEITGNLQYSIIVAIIIYFCIAFDLYNLTRYKKNRLNFVISAFIGGIIGSALLGMGASWGVALGVAMVGGILGAATIYGGLALLITNYNKSAKSADYGSTSATYANPTLSTQTNPDLPVPMLYGTVKLAGNRIWQDDNSSTTVKRIVAFAEGEITGFTDIRLNDISTSDISGITVNKYYGTSTQTIDSMISGSTQAARAATVGGLRNIAYLAVTVPVSSDIDYNYNLTAVVQGRKIRVYTDEDTYTTEYSENPAWVLLDFLTAYNGLGLGLDNDGTRNNTTIKALFDLDTFIESAAFCDTVLTDTLTGTVSTSGTTVTGSGTAFETEILIGDTILIEGQERTVTAISSNTSLTVNSSFSTYSGKTAYERQARFSFNMIFDSQTSARDLIDEINRNCRGCLTAKNGKLQFKIDKAESVSKVFTADNIITGSEVFQTIPREEQYEILRMTFISPGYEWQKVEAFAELSEYRDGAPIEHSVNCYSCTRFKQASRLAWYYINSKKLCPYFGSFQTDYRAYDLELGDVIQHESPLMGTTLTSKVTSVINDGAGVFTVNWRNYDADLYTDALGSLQPTAIVTNLSDVYVYPGDVQTLSAIQNQKLVEFTWTEVAGTNIKYEIRVGSSWANSSLIATGLEGTSYSATLKTTGTFTYWIKAKNQYQSSENATSDILNVQYIPEMNEIVVTSILENPNGTYNNTYIYRERLKIDAAIYWQDLTPETWLDSDGRYYADASSNWGTTTVASNEGTEVTLQDDEGNTLIDDEGNSLIALDNLILIAYTSEIFDLNAILSNIVSCDYNSYLTNSSQSIEIYWKYSDDNITWSDWVLVTTGSYAFRYYQIRIKFINPYGNVMWLNEFNFSIDVPDRNENYTNREITTAADGVTITYSTDIQSKYARVFYIDEPHVIATPKSNDTYAVITSSIPESCTIKLYTNDGSLTTGFVNISVSGY